MLSIDAKFAHLNLKNLDGRNFCNCQRIEMFPAISADILMICLHTGSYLIKVLLYHMHILYCGTLGFVHVQ
jgi:hypothetical protein